MDLLQTHGIAVPRYQVADSAEQVFKIAKEFGELQLFFSDVSVNIAHVNCYNAINGNC
jgi:succinyl-CoA synthetase beta subunit